MSDRYNNKGAKCLSCGHLVRYSPKGKMRCNRCYAKEHPAESKPKRDTTLCFNCGNIGHSAKSCHERRCPHCKAIGHKLADCPQANVRFCIHCGERGHSAPFCPLASDYLHRSHTRNQTKQFRRCNDNSSSKSVKLKPLSVSQTTAQRTDDCPETTENLDGELSTELEDSADIINKKP